MKSKEFKVYHPRPNWNGETKWLKLYSSMIISCCDCGLAHQFKFKTIDDKLFWRAKRHKEVTKENRKNLKYRKVKKI